MAARSHDDLPTGPTAGLRRIDYPLLDAGSDHLVVSDADLLVRVQSLNARVAELLVARNRELQEHGEELALEVGALRERSTLQAERIAELSWERDTLRREGNQLQAAVGELGKEQSALRATVDTIASGQQATGQAYGELRQEVQALHTLVDADRRLLMRLTLVVGACVVGIVAVGVALALWL